MVSVIGTYLEIGLLQMVNISLAFEYNLEGFLPV